MNVSSTLPECRASGGWLGKLGSAGLAAAAGLALAVNSYSEAFHSARLGVALVVLLLFHLLRTPHLVILREAVIYACFLGYMLVELLWTPDRALALNTLVPSANFLLILVLFGSLAACHDLRSVLAGTLIGFLIGALAYMASTGFPFRYPADFSYNAIALMFLFGLLCALLLAAVSRWQRTLLVLSAGLMAMIVGTTSIKTNLGVLLGALVAGVIHFGYLARMLMRNAVMLVALAAALAYGIAARDGIVESVQRGAERVALGIEVLQAREGVEGYSAFEERAAWQRAGLAGWAGNPVFGHGVEAFRGSFGMTSHATPVDILYNSGVIGLALFYGVLLSLMGRLYRARDQDRRAARAIILGGIVCYLFISLSGTIHYVGSMAAFIALGSAMLRRAAELPRAPGGALARA